MGVMYAVRCPGCDYWAEIYSGSGFHATIEPFTCRRCNDIVSVLIRVRDKTTDEETCPTPVCPECDSTDVEPWPPGRSAALEDAEANPPMGPCPECGATTVDDGARGLWD